MTSSFALASKIGVLRLPDPDDRHVLAAAIHAQARAIVTFNLSDFPASALQTERIAAVHPDAFVEHLVAQRPYEIAAVLQAQARALRSPIQSVSELMATLAQAGVPRSMDLLRPRVGG